MDWAEIRQYEPAVLLTLDEDAYSAALIEAGVQGHQMEELHVHKPDRGRTRYSRCTWCQLSVWVLDGRTTRLQAGLGWLCAGSGEEEQGPRAKDEHEEEARAQGPKGRLV